MANINLSTIVDALDANLNQMWQDGLQSWKEEYSTVFSVLSSTKTTEKDSYESGFGLMPEKQEGVAATYDVIYPGISKVYVHKTYALGYEITEEAVEDNQQTPETFNKLPQALSRSAMETIEITSFNIFNNAFTTAGFDGVSLCNISHPLLGGGTQSNKPTVDADLGVASLTSALSAIEKLTDERGLKTPVKAVLLMVPVDLWNVAAELLGSEYKPYTGNNEKNVLQEKDLRYFVCHYLTDTDAWFLLAEKAQTQLKFWWRVKLGALRRGNDFDTTNLKHLGRMRFSVGYSHYMGTYGSVGA